MSDNEPDGIENATHNTFTKLRVIMSLTKLVMQPTIHVPDSFFTCVFIDYSTNDFDSIRQM
jgi:hypothetical protein